jgi:hypothetical protein
MNYDEFPVMKNGYLPVPKPSELLLAHDVIYERFCSAIYMAANIHCESGTHLSHVVASQVVLKAYFRASLAEFVSLEDALKVTDYPDVSVFSITKSTNPLFHNMKLLRDYNTHLGITLLEKTEVVITLGSNKSEEFGVSAAIIDNLNFEDLKQLRNAKFYSDDDLCKMVEMFNEQQMKFGVGDLIIKGLIMYSEFVGKLLTSNKRRYR